jgi:hypothetical protein
MDLIKRDSFDPMRFMDGVTVSARSISDYRADGSDPVPLLYQSGYLTITGYDEDHDEYALDFPNDEVRYGFLEDLRRGDVNGFMERLRSLYAKIPYELSGQTERHYQLVFTLVFTLIEERGYAVPYGADGRKVVKVGVAFDGEARNVGQWVVG